MNCLDNIIGINRTCAQPVPVSGLYIQDLPGIELKVADAIVGSEFASGVRFLLSKIEFAKNLMLAQIRAQLQEKLKYGTILANDNVGYVDYNSIISSEVGKLKGIQINVRDYPYFELFLQSVSVFATESKDINVLIYDLITGTLLQTISVTTIADQEVNVLIDKTFYSQRKAINIFVCTDSDLGHYQGLLSRTHCAGCTNTINNAYSYVSYSEIQQGSPVLYKNLKGGQSTGGLSVSYSLSCSLEPFLCNLGSQLGFPLLYKAGSVIMDEAVNTGRINPIVLTKKDDWAGLSTSFEAQYLTSIMALMNNLRLPDDICFQCNSKIRNVVRIP